MAKRLLSWVVLGAIVPLLVVGCASNPQQSAKSSSSGSDGLFVSMDIDLVRDERELVNRATLVAHAVPVGNAEVVSLGREGVVVNYYQDVKVNKVIKGQAPGETARIVTTGIDPGARASYEARARARLFIEDEEHFNGPLASSEAILFLQPSAKAGVFQVVGLRQGIFPVNAQGQIISAHNTVKSFVSLDVAGVRQRIDELSQ